MDTVSNLEKFFGSAWHVQSAAILKRLGHTTNAGDPTNSLTPDFRGQFCFDTSNNDWYKSTGTTSADWALMSIGSISAAELGVLDGVTAGTMTASKALVVDASGQIDKVKSPVDSNATSSVTIHNYGHTQLSATSEKNYLLAAPEAGLVKRISKSGNSSEALTVTLANSSEVKFRLPTGGDTGTTLTFKNKGDFVEVEGLSTTLYAVTATQSASSSAKVASS